MPAQMRQFLDTTGGLWFNGKLVNKVVSAMTSLKTLMVVKNKQFYHYIHQCITGEQL